MGGPAWLWAGNFGGNTTDWSWEGLLLTQFQPDADTRVNVGPLIFFKRGQKSRFLCKRPQFKKYTEVGRKCFGRQALAWGLSV